MRILHVVPTYLPAWRHGGPIFAIHGLAKALVARGHEVSVFTTNVHAHEDLEVPLARPVDLDGVAVRYFPTRLSRRLYRSPTMAAALAQEMPRQDVAHLHSLFLWPPAAAGRAARLARVPYLVAPRGMLVQDLIRQRGRWRKRLWLAAVDRPLLERAAGLHVTSELEAAEARRFGWHLPELFVVPNGIDLAELEDRPDAALSPAVDELVRLGPFFLCLGRISWKKGLDRVIAALAELGDGTLVLAGNDEEGLAPALSRQAQSLGVAHRLRLPGPVSGADKAALLARCAALVLPSLSENFGNVVLEAMGAGRPVVLSPEVGLASEVLQARAGLVVPADSSTLARALRSLLADPDQAAQMGRRGAELVRRRFTWAAVAEQMEKVYQEVQRRAGSR
ncbi:MAG: glycosyltransferase [Thermoanaerobaculia bacterium]